VGRFGLLITFFHVGFFDNKLTFFVFLIFLESLDLKVLATGTYISPSYNFLADVAVDVANDMLPCHHVLLTFRPKEDIYDFAK
jgi:hypothetical protein